MRHTSFGEVAKWVHDAWAAVSVSTVTAGFRKAGLIACDPECNNETQSGSDSEANDGDPAMLPTEVAELFESASKEKAFDGFEWSAINDVSCAWE